MKKVLAVTGLIFFLSSNAYAQQYMPMEPPLIFRIIGNPLFVFLSSLFVVVLLLSWTILPFAIFGIKKDLNRIEKNTRYLEEILRLLKNSEKDNS